MILFPSSIPLILVILSVILAFCLYMIIVELWPTVEEEKRPCALSTTLTSLTSARMEFMYGGMPGPGSPSCDTDLLERIFGITWPSALKIVLSNETHSGTYLFESFEDGLLILDNGDYMGNLTYVNIADNEKINYGDVVRMEGLGPESHYTIEIIWYWTNEVIAVAGFYTPTQ